MNITLDLSADGSEAVTHPCEVINHFALKLISNLSGSGGAGNAGWAAFTHDSYLTSIMQDSEQVLPAEAEIIRRVCEKFKFVVEEGKPYLLTNTIRTTTLSITDRELLRQTSLPDYGDALIIPVLIEFRELENASEPRSEPQRRTIHARYRPSPSPTPPASPHHKSDDDGEVPTYAYRRSSRSPSPSPSMSSSSH
ncbi:Protein kinase of the Mitotic Exit Network [Marasmius crinis-equi]|uniref:Protein kinase of the Mitotic Exit Network n=1 Tax=Marasmius crinis-equi TaxID=585013 RepID=A0ABR3FKN2_9AGAR